MQIPGNHLLQTYFTALPEHINQNRQNFCSEFTPHTYQDDDCIRLLRDELGEAYAQRFRLLWCGAHKADFFRYCFLYLYGGMYVDAKSLFMRPISEWLVDKGNSFITVRVGHRSHNGFIVTPAKHPLMKQAMLHALTVDFDELNNDYLLLCRQLWVFMQDFLQRTPKSGWNASAQGSIYLLDEKTLSEIILKNGKSALTLYGAHTNMHINSPG